MLTTPLANRNSRYLKNSSTNTAFILGAAGTVGWEREIVRVQTIPDGSFYPLNGALSLCIKFWGQGANNSTFDFNVWLGNELQSREPQETQAERRSSNPANGGIDLWFAGTGNATLSTSVIPPASDPYIVANPKVTSGTLTVCYADVVTWTISSGSTTPKGPMNAIETAFGEGTSQVFAGDSDKSPGYLILPALGRANVIVLDFKCNSNCVAANAVIEAARP